MKRFTKIIVLFGRVNIDKPMTDIIDIPDEYEAVVIDMAASVELYSTSLRIVVIRHRKMYTISQLLVYMLHPETFHYTIDLPCRAARRPPHRRARAERARARPWSGPGMRWNRVTRRTTTLAAVRV